MEPTGDGPGIRQMYRTAEGAAAPPGPDASLGDLVARMTSQLSVLFRKEIELAKIELKEETVKAGKAGRLLGGAGVAAAFALLLLSFAAAWGLAEVMPAGYAFLIVGGLYVIAAAVMFIGGRNRLRQVQPVPQQTVETLQEDAQWAKHPTS